MRVGMLSWLAMILACGAAPVRAADLALVLLTDVSSSMDDHELALVKAGYRAAFADPEVIDALLGNAGGVAVAYVEFSGKHEVALVEGWNLLHDAPSAQAFGEAVASAPRSAAGDTNIGAGLASAAQLLQGGAFGSARQVIDVVSDETGDGGRTAQVRDSVVASGITINAIPLVPRGAAVEGHRSMGPATARWGAGSVTDFYRREIAGGIDSFVIEATGIDTFAEALKRKLLQELIASR